MFSTTALQIASTCSSPRKLVSFVTATSCAALPYYNLPVLTGFLYRVYVPTMMVLDSESDFRFDMYHRMDITDEEVILSEVLEDEQYTEIGDNEDGRNYINEVLISAAAESSNSLYDASRAVAYAVAHAKDIPEYSAANNVMSTKTSTSTYNASPFSVWL